MMNLKVHKWDRLELCYAFKSFDCAINYSKSLIDMTVLPREVVTIPLTMSPKASHRSDKRNTYVKGDTIEMK